MEGRGEGGEEMGEVALSVGEGGVRWRRCETERHLCNLALCITTSE